MISKEVADLLNIDDTQIEKTKTHTLASEIVNFIRDNTASEYHFPEILMKKFADVQAEDFKFSVDDYEEIHKSLLEKYKTTDYWRDCYTDGFFKLCLNKKVKFNSQNIGVFTELSVEHYKELFNSLEEGFKLNREQFLPFFESKVKDFDTYKYHTNNKITLEEIIRLSGYTPTIGDVKYCLKNGYSLWSKNAIYNHHTCVFKYIQNPEKYGITPDRELFEYCKSIPVYPSAYKFTGVSKQEIEELKEKMFFIEGISVLLNQLTVNKFKKLRKRYKNVPIDKDVIRIILMKPIKEDIVRHLIEQEKVEFSEEHINSYMMCNLDGAKKEFWITYKEKTDKRIKELESQLKKRKVE